MSSHLVTMVGANFRSREAKAVTRHLYKGQALKLERDAENAYDPNAIQVVEPESGEFIGFIPKELAAELAPLIDNGAATECSVAEIYSEDEGNPLKPKLNVSVED